MKFMLICAICCVVSAGLVGCSQQSGKKAKESKDYPFPSNPPPPN